LNKVIEGSTTIQKVEYQLVKWQVNGHWNADPSIEVKI
jgi:hypothetical protein